MAHRIVWCTAATVDANSSPRTRVLHPIWEFDGERLVGWIATSPESPKADDLAAHPAVSLTYWTSNHDTCTAVRDRVGDDATGALGRLVPLRRWARTSGSGRGIIPGWTSPDAPGFGILRLEPHRLRVMPGSFMLAGQGELLTWRGPGQAAS